MKKQKIIYSLAKNRFVEKLLSTQTSFKSNPYIEDLAQDIYIILLNTEDETIERLYEEKAFAYYVVRIIKNNLFSTTSEFYYKYQKYRRFANELPQKI